MKKLSLIILFVVFICIPSFSYGFPAVRVYKSKSKAVVLIISQKDSKSSMLGAGSIISPEGYVVTNAHVVINRDISRPFSRITVYIKPDRLSGDFRKDISDRYKARVTAYDTGLDIAVLKIEGFHENTGLIKLADSGKVDIGEEVVAIGHPEQGGLWSLTYGRISGEIANQSNIPGKDVFQTDTSMNRGNSGGPLLDARGYMVGINTNIARVGAGNLPITGVNFALKSSVVKKWLDSQGFSVAYGKEPVDAQKQAVKDDMKEGDDNKGLVTGASGISKNNKLLPDEGLDKKRPQIEEALNEKSVVQAEKKDRILTPKRPYRMDDLFREVEKELENMMEEMRMKIRKR
ncbi:putative periplasmic serine endoprotease DegP-like precursor [bacterium BMS3Abin07]|nr:putative periplasmic serine endoprotease DegP-like precursor [bacterium BMS3Abin07]HDL20058.1 trypsin-like serine protease [Nitrospirota bacterium]HDO23312.1 trypsin-like serine protease [Nitrospirota bacterium]HDZ88669.1 trypsin-like serine protease [Nitrospirota bacterium]